MKKAFVVAALMFGIGGPALAVGNLADVTIYDRAQNQMLPVYHHAGRHYVVGKPGNEYQISVRNNLGSDVLTVISVDGVNAVSGETANWNQAGYVLSPYATYGIKGWRKSLQRIAAFFFTEHDNAYATRTGRPDNVGVIGVAVFRKKPEPAVGIIPDYRQRREAPAPGSAANEAESAAQDAARGAAADAASPQASAVAPRTVEKSLGTGHGRSETSVVRPTSFERVSSTPDEVITIFYDTYRNLVAQGVIKDAPRIARPNPFPGQFVPDPR